MRPFRLYHLLAITAILLAATVATAAPIIRDFTFIHVSDEHSDDAQTTPDNLKEMARLAGLTSIALPYNITVPPPSFIISTGDITEFGPVNSDYSIIKERYREVGLPLYGALGNHDCTWGGSLTREWTKLYGAPYYSFDRNGCHFVILDSAGLLEMRPNLSPEELDWLKTDLARVGKERPVFIAMHHPINTSELATPYETDRLTDILRPYNIAAILVGHYHTAAHKKIDGLDMVIGGSAYGREHPGFQIVSIADGKLRIAYKELGQTSPATPILQKPLFVRRAKYPEIKIESPEAESTHTGETAFKIRPSLREEQIAESYIMVDGTTRIDLTREPDGDYRCRLDNSTLAPGAHYARICFKDRAGETYHRSTRFYAETGEPRAIWRTYLGGASRSVPTVAENTLYVGANNGTLHALDAQTGKPKWAFKTGGAITCQPLILRGTAIFGSEDETLYCLSAADGTPIWKYRADQPIYAGPVTDGRYIYFVTMDGTSYAVNATDGTLKWRDREAKYNVPSKPSISNGRLCYTSWDSYIYCQDTWDGKLLWKRMGQGAAEGEAPIYYSPAKVTPVQSETKVFAADVKCRLTVIDRATGEQEKYLKSISTVALSEDGKNLYLIGHGPSLVKTDIELGEIWRTPIPASTENAPVEQNGGVYLSSNSGLVTALAADTGKILWQYQATNAYILSSPGVTDQAVYITGNDGYITALRK